MYTAMLTHWLLPSIQLDLSPYISSHLMSLIMAFMASILHKLEKLILIHSKNEQN